MVLLNVYRSETLNGLKPWETGFRRGRDASLHGLVAIGCIFIWQNMLPEITFQRWSNPDSEEYSGRDYFMVMESIFIRQDLQSGIIFIGEKHLNLEECSYKDAFVVEQ